MPPNPQSGDFSSRTETAITAGSEGRKAFRTSLTRNWRIGSLVLGLLLFLVWGYFYIPGHVRYWVPGNGPQAQAGSAQVGASQEQPDTTVYDTITPDHPVEAVMVPGTQIDVSVDLQKVDQRVVWRPRKDGLKDKVRIFSVKSGVDKVNISIRTYPCSADSPCDGATPGVGTSSPSQDPEKTETSEDEPPPLPDGIPEKQ